MAGSLKMVTKELAEYLIGVQVIWNFDGIKLVDDYILCMEKKIYNCHIRTLFIHYKVRPAARK
jgi:hypothetical protein